MPINVNQKHFDHGLRNRNSSMCFILPDFELVEIIKQGTSEESDAALTTLSISSSLRGERRALVTIAPEIIPSAGEKMRTVSNAKNTTDLPGQVMRREGQTDSGDLAVDEAYNYCGDTYDFYRAVFQRNSIDDNNMPLNSTVHFATGFDNAFWNGKRMIYGDGGVVMNRTTQCIDVVAHELTHGVTGNEAALDYFRQPGALNESWSDVMGILVKQYHLKQSVEESNWLIGEGLMRNAKALRSMKDPGFRSKQPDHMDNYVHTTTDNGGVHINSGIPNKAFYLAAMDIGGNAWEKVGKIWYVTLRDRLRPYSQFVHAAYHTLEVAGTLFGQGSKEQSAVNYGWQSVGVKKERPT
jgi:Zn-dependent metalloprotease